MEQPHRSLIIEHFIAAQDNAHLLSNEDSAAAPGDDDATATDAPGDAVEDVANTTPDDAIDPSDAIDAADDGTELFLSPPDVDPADLPVTDDPEINAADVPEPSLAASSGGDGVESPAPENADAESPGAALPVEEVFSLEDVPDEDTIADEAMATGPATLDVEGTAAVARPEPEPEPVVPAVEPAVLGVRAEQGRVWLSVPSDASIEAVIAGLDAVELPGGVLWLALDARATSAEEVQRLRAAADAVLGRPVAGVRVFRGGLADGLRKATGLVVEIDGDSADKSSSDARGRQVLVVERTLRSGSSTRFRGDILVYGDVNAGAEVEAAGNIVVLGALRGLAWAGTGGDESAMVISFDLRPTQVRIGRRIAFLPERPRGRTPRLPEVAVVQDDEIVLREYRGRLG